MLVLACLYLVKSFASTRTGRDGHEPITDSKLAPVVRHETWTQTDVTSASSEQTDAQTNPFETENSDAAENTDHQQANETETKTINETGETTDKDVTAEH